MFFLGSNFFNSTEFAMTERISQTSFTSPAAFAWSMMLPKAVHS